MIGISIAEENEWISAKKYYCVNECIEYPYGEYFNYKLNDKNVIFYRCNVRKTSSSAAAQYMIDYFNLSKIIVIGTCAGIDTAYQQYDVIIPNLAVQTDCTVRETEPLIKTKFNVEIDLSKLNIKYNTGTIATQDKPIVMWNDYIILKDNNITICDTEAASIAYVCKRNNVDVLIIKGISDFPTNEEESTKEISHEEQYKIFIRNIPIIMNKIFDNYLDKVV
jgi:adenosylhomocysteine nucleosidase/adenosylhomocysteine/aminodeoxyfutalosine nucleosidase